MSCSFSIGAPLINHLRDYSCVASKLDLSCGIKCKFMWDGFGRWLGKNWKPYLRGTYFGMI